MDRGSSRWVAATVGHAGGQPLGGALSFDSSSTRRTRARRDSASETQEYGLRDAGVPDAGMCGGTRNRQLYWPSRPFARQHMWPHRQWRRHDHVTSRRGRAVVLLPLATLAIAGRPSVTRRRRWCVLSHRIVFGRNPVRRGLRDARQRHASSRYERVETAKAAGARERAGASAGRLSAPPACTRCTPLRHSP
jgi:hypothetical protein